MSNNEKIDEIKKIADSVKHTAKIVGAKIYVSSEDLNFIKKVQDRFGGHFSDLENWKKEYSLYF